MPLAGSSREKTFILLQVEATARPVVEFALYCLAPAESPPPPLVAAVAAIAAAVSEAVSGIPPRPSIAAEDGGGIPGKAAPREGALLWRLLASPSLVSDPSCMESRSPTSPTSDPSSSSSSTSSLASPQEEDAAVVVDSWA